MPGVTDRKNLVYFVGPVPDGPVKIGLTTNMPKRLKCIEVHSPVSVAVLGVIPGGLERERELHREFRHLRRHGEWFHLDSAMKEFISRNCEPWTSPGDAKGPREPKSGRRTTCFSCTPSYKSWLLEFAARERTNFTGLARFGMEILSALEGEAPPPSDSKPPGRPNRSQGRNIGISHTPEWRRWLVEYATRADRQLSVLVALGFAALAEDRLFPPPPERNF